jgi:hypothetical protein
VFIEGALVFGVFPFLAPLFEARGIGGAAAAGAGDRGLRGRRLPLRGAGAWLLRRLGQARMVVLGGGVAAAGQVGLAVAPGRGGGGGCCLTLGLGFYMIHSSIQTRVTEVAPGARGSAVALHAFSFFLGQAFGPVAMGGRGGRPSGRRRRWSSPGSGWRRWAPGSGPRGGR